MRAVTKPYPPTSVVGAIILSRLGILPGRHALDIKAVACNQPTRLVAKLR